MEDTNVFKTERRATSATLSGVQTHEAVSLYFLVKTWRLLFPIAFADGCGSDPQGCKSVTTQLSCSANLAPTCFFAFIRIPTVPKTQIWWLPDISKIFLPFTQRLR